ncbi:MAG: IS110 family transposase [Chloroflexota bacterium]|nr:IS110 family transposase [Chloroflexota bacterium]
MNVVNERCAGLDIHKKTIAACVIVPGRDGAPGKQVRTFGTMTDDLLALADWLTSEDVTHVAMESTGVFWKAPYNLLEADFTLLLVNPQHIKAVPGRKTDVKDCEWIADLLRHGLLRASFVPNREHRELRELTRYRTSLVRERADEVNRVQKTLEGANVKLASVATDILGKSGRQMLDALVAGSTDTAAMAQLAQRRMRSKIPQLERALAGRFGEHQRFLVTRQLAHIDFLDGEIATVSAAVEERLRPFQAELDRLDSIPGIDRRNAEVIVAELGTDMSRFPTYRHLASWARLCPGNNESAGKRKSGKTGRGNPWLRTALVQAAQAAGHTSTYLAAQLHRLTSRRGQKKAVVAVAHTILIIAYHVLKNPAMYAELGKHYFDERDRDAIKDRLVRRLKTLGFDVALTPQAA